MDLSGWVLRSLSDRFIMPRTFKSCIKLLSHCTTDIKLVPEHNETHQILSRFSKRVEKIKPYTSKQTKSSLHLLTKRSKSFKKTKKIHQVRPNTKEIKILHRTKGIYKRQICIRFLYLHYPNFSKEVNYFQMIIYFKIQLPR